MKVALYFGSFNPVHAGHIGLANFVLENKLADELWLIVSPINPLKEQSELISEVHRMKMLQLAIKNNDRIKISDIEFDMPKPSYTIFTLEKLALQHPDNQFILMIGSDNALVFNQWKDYKTILQKYPVWVYPRLNYDLKDVENLYPEMRKIESPYFDISSTVIRHQIKSGKNPGKWLHPDVYKYILKHQLYL